MYHDLQKFGISEFKTIFDAGANIGQTATAYSQNFPKSTIYSFEPIDSSYNLLVKNTEKLGNVICFKLALGSVREQIDIHVEDKPASTTNSLNQDLIKVSSSTRKQLIQIETLQNFINNNQIKSIDLLKIDTEGWELEVIKGAHDLIYSVDIKLILCEVGFSQSNLRNTPFLKVNDLVSSLGYTFCGLYDISLRQIKTANHYGNALYASKKCVENYEQQSLP